MMARRFCQIFPELQTAKMLKIYLRILLFTWDQVGHLHGPANTLTATLQAFERYGVMRILAEPTVTPDNPNFAWARRPIVFGGGKGTR